MHSDIINICGGINVFASTPSLTQVISEEDLLKADPDAIVSSVSLELGETGIGARSATFSQISAVRNNHIFFVHPDLINRQTVRMLAGGESRLRAAGKRSVGCGKKTIAVCSGTD